MNVYDKIATTPEGMVFASTSHKAHQMYRGWPRLVGEVREVSRKDVTCYLGWPARLHPILTICTCSWVCSSSMTDLPSVVSD